MLLGARNGFIEKATHLIAFVAGLTQCAKLSSVSHSLASLSSVDMANEEWRKAEIFRGIVH
jgi:hypothetical protein